MPDFGMSDHALLAMIAIMLVVVAVLLWNCAGTLGRIHVTLLDFVERRLPSRPAWADDLDDWDDDEDDADTKPGS